jgi:hypothetical protein
MAHLVNWLFGCCLLLIFHIHVSFSRPSIFRMSKYHPYFSSSFFSFFIFLYSSLCFILYFIFLTAHCPSQCIPTAHFLVFLLLLCAPLLCASSILIIFSQNVIPKNPIQQVPNTHPWLVLSHSILFPSLPCHNCFLGGFLCYLHLFDDVGLYFCDLLGPLRIQSCQFLLCFICCMFYLSVHSG